MAHRNPPTEWRPVAVGALGGELEGFEDWVLCGGHSVALLTGKDTRAHGDIDVGVFRSQLGRCPRVLAAERVFLCRRGIHEAWDGGEVPDEVHDLWVTDAAGQYWAFQVMVYDDQDETVIYRRDRRITWPKRCHSIQIAGLKVLNPLVTVLFKASAASLQDKEAHDLAQLIECCHVARGEGCSPARPSQGK